MTETDAAPEDWYDSDEFEQEAAAALAELADEERRQKLEEAQSEADSQRDPDDDLPGADDGE